MNVCPLQFLGLLGDGHQTRLHFKLFKVMVGVYMHCQWSSVYRWNWWAGFTGWTEDKAKLTNQQKTQLNTHRLCGHRRAEQVANQFMISFKFPPMLPNAGTQEQQSFPPALLRCSAIRDLAWSSQEMQIWTVISFCPRQRASFQGCIQSKLDCCSCRSGISYTVKTAGKTTPCVSP